MARYVMKDGALLEDLSGDRSFYPHVFYSYDSRGRQREVLGYEVCEWRRISERKGLGTNGRVYTVLQYKHAKDAECFLRLLEMVLNNADTSVTAWDGTPAEYIHCPQIKACIKDISKHVWDILIHAPLDEIAERHERNEKLFRKIREAKHPELTRIYAMLFDNNCVKIGFSKDVYTRANTLKIPPLEILKLAYTTQCYTVERAREIEAECHKFFSSRRRVNEYFNISFDEACEKIKNYSDIFIDDLGL